MKKRLSTYTVIWHYIANYCTSEVHAESPEQARKIATMHFGPQFHAHATVYVFDRPPVLIVTKGERFPVVSIDEIDAMIKGEVSK